MLEEKERFNDRLQTGIDVYTVPAAKQKKLTNKKTQVKFRRGKPKFQN